MIYANKTATTKIIEYIGLIIAEKTTMITEMLTSIVSTFEFSLFIVEIFRKIPLSIS